MLLNDLEKGSREYFKTTQFFKLDQIHNCINQIKLFTNHCCSVILSPSVYFILKCLVRWKIESLKIHLIF